jgi:hypothetical protein
MDDDGRNAPRTTETSVSRRKTMLPSSISSSGSPTTLPSLLSECAMPLQEVLQKEVLQKEALG